MLRLFIAVEISKKQKEEISVLQHLLKHYLKGVRWVRPEGMHLTLKFLGDTEKQKVDIVREVMDNSLYKLSPFSLRLGGSGVFPSPAKARVIWLGVNMGAEQTEMITEKINSGLRSQGFPREKRKFHPHLTIGRIRYPEPVDSIKKFIEEQEQFQTVSAEIRRITLFQSTLTGKGAIYDALHYSQFNED